MNWSAGARWLRALTSSRAQRRLSREDDFADMGTAFGLDAITTLQGERFAASTGAGALDGSAASRLAARLHRRSSTL